MARVYAVNGNPRIAAATTATRRGAAAASTAAGLPLRLDEAQQCEEERALASARAAHDPDLGGRAVTEGVQVRSNNSQCARLTRAPS